MARLMPRVVVVGSGPAAAGTVSALMEAGIRPTVLDAGLQPDPNALRIKRELSAQPTSAWTREMIEDAKGHYRCTPAGLEIKKQFGSDFATRIPKIGLDLVFNNVEHAPSFALGGLSNIWGASVLPYRAADISGWPIGLDDLMPHYRAVSQLVGGTGEEGDAIDDLFPSLSRPLPALPMCRSGKHILETVTKHRSELEQAGLYCGMARVAMDPSNCRRCGLCMHGCPDDLIYSSLQTFARWSAEGRIDYRSGKIVREVRETDASVQVFWDDLSGESGSETFDRAFLAAGVICTTAITLRSSGRYNHPVRGCDSHYFLFPLLSFKRSPQVRSEPLQTLSQVFIDVVSLADSNDRTAHVQLYGYSDIIDASVCAMLGPASFLAPLILERLVIGQCFLHSDYSASLIYELKHTASGRDELQISSADHPGTARMRKHVLRRLMSNARAVGAIPLPWFAKIGAPGRSLHCGSTFPMSRNPAGNETDLLGRPVGWQRLHLVDSSVFPSIPGTTIGLSNMANAHRIGDTVARELN